MLGIKEGRGGAGVRLGERFTDMSRVSAVKYVRSRECMVNNTLSKELPIVNEVGHLNGVREIGSTIPDNKSYIHQGKVNMHEDV